MITVDELRSAVLPAGTVLLGGESGCGQSVSGAATLRARTPAFPPLHGGELALVPLTILRQLESHPRPDRLVEQLSQAGVAAVAFLCAPDERLAGVRSTGGAGTVGRVAAPVVDGGLREAGRRGDALGLPVLVVGAGEPAEEIEQALHRYVSARRDAVVRRSQEFHGVFTQLALSGRGLPAIVEHLAKLTGFPAAWEDAHLELRNWALPGGEGAGERASEAGALGAVLGELADVPTDVPALLRGARLPLQRWLQTFSRGGRAGATQPWEAGVAILALRADEDAGALRGLRRLMVTFAAAGRLAGYLSLIVPVEAPGMHEAHLALAAAGLAASIEALRLHTVSEATGNALAALLQDWLAGRFESGAELGARAAQLGQTLRPPYAVLIAEGALPETLPVEIARQDSATLAVDTGAGRTSWLIPVTDAAQVAAIPAALGSATAGGLGRIALRIEDVPRAYREALQALDVSQRLGRGATSGAGASGDMSGARVKGATSGSGSRDGAESREGQGGGGASGVASAGGEGTRIAFFGTLGVHRLLAAVSPPEELAAFFEDVLGPLAAHDARTNGQLLQTLDAYLATGGSVQETAERLHTHRNTVLYRLERIHSVLGTDPRRPGEQLSLQLALRAAELMPAGSSAPGVPTSGPAAQMAPV